MDDELSLDQSYTPKRGQFAGRTFKNQSEYQKVLREEGVPRKRKEESLDPELSALGDVAPKRKGSASFADDIRALVELVNAGLSLFPATREDVLDEREAEIATLAVDRWQQSDKRVARWFKKLQSVGGYAGLIYAGLIIGVPRLQRHGFLPGGSDEPLTAEQAQQFAALNHMMESAQGVAAMAKEMAPDYSRPGDASAWANSRPVPPVFTGIGEA